jgi:hypothetical protein
MAGKGIWNAKTGVVERQRKSEGVRVKSVRVALKPMWIEEDSE